MTTATRAAPIAQRPNNGQAPRPKLGRIEQSSTIAPRIILNAVEGFGKTTFAAYAPNCALLMSRGETGYDTLRQAGRVPDCDRVELSSWQHVLDQMDEFLIDCKYGAIALDALGGFERLCHEHVCVRDFGNDWGEKGFGAFQKGFDVSITEWLLLLQRLDRIRTARQIPIIILSHSKIRPFKNPLGSDFDRYIADCHDKTWGVTHKWADAVLFGTFQTVAVEDKKNKRMKGIGGTERVVFSERRDAYDAKNRYGLPAQIDLPDDPKRMWSTVWDAIVTPVDADDAPPM